MSAASSRKDSAAQASGSWNAAHNSPVMLVLASRPSPQRLGSSSPMPHSKSTRFRKLTRTASTMLRAYPTYCMLRLESCSAYTPTCSMKASISALSRPLNNPVQ